MGEVSFAHKGGWVLFWVSLSHHGPQRHHGSANLFHLHALFFIQWNVADVHSHLRKQKEDCCQLGALLILFTVFFHSPHSPKAPRPRR